MPPSSKLTLEQERAVYELSQQGLKDQEIAAQLALQGVHVARQTVGNVRRRVEQRAMAAPPIPAQDPATGIQVELSDDAVLAQMMRELNASFYKLRSKGEHIDSDLLAQQIAIAHVIPKLATVRQRMVRQPTPPGPQPPGPQPAPEAPPSPEPPRLSAEELERRAWEGLN